MAGTSSMGWNKCSESSLRAIASPASRIGDKSSRRFDKAQDKFRKMANAH
jgi:hypothetical protein